MLKTIDHGDGLIELNMARPPVNALNAELVQALDTAITAAPEQGARAVVLSGQPGMFSAGLDVPALLQLDKPAMADFWSGFFNLLRHLAESPVPVIAAMPGHSPAGGAVMAIFCDYRIAAGNTEETSFKIGLNEVQVGLPVPAVVYAALERLIGPREAERLAVRGLLVSPDEALRIGLVNELATPDKVIDTAIAHARQLLALPSSALAMTRQTARAGLHKLCEQGVGLDDLETVWNAPETQAALKAMVAQLQAKRQ
ncbi:MAG TPA: enoyl-CoA hydratase/isomerase family protein [Gammaproteobacteria bacterium]|nr:enoyl-CoA hydratase/isomerase family protein [Gammaproteobacteria bacterium]